MFENALFESIDNKNKPKRSIYFLISSLIHLLVIFLIVVYPLVIHNDFKHINKKNQNVVNSKDMNKELEENSYKNQNKKRYNKEENYVSNDLKQDFKANDKLYSYKLLNDFVKVHINNVSTDNKTRVVFLNNKVNYKIRDNRKYFKYKLRVNAETNGNINEIKIINGNPLIKEIVFRKIKEMKFKLISKQSSRKEITFDIIVDFSINSDFYSLIKCFYEFIFSKIRFFKKIILAFGLIYK